MVHPYTLAPESGLAAPPRTLCLELYQLYLDSSNDKVELAIQETYTDKNHPFCKFDSEKLQLLLQCIIAEIFCHSNFEEKLKKSDIIINKDTIPIDRRIAVTISIRYPRFMDKHRKGGLNPDDRGAVRYIVASRD